MQFQARGVGGSIVIQEIMKFHKSYIHFIMRPFLGTVQCTSELLVTLVYPSWTQTDRKPSWTQTDRKLWYFV